jgi:hypothetical protein
MKTWTQNIRRNRRMVGGKKQGGELRIFKSSSDEITLLLSTNE